MSNQFNWRVMGKIFVTGANGHIGCNTVRELLRSGYAIKALVRKNSDLRGLKGLKIEIVEGDVLDEQSLIKGSKDCEAIVHHAAVYRFFEKDLQKIMAPAVEGTNNIFKAASNNKINKIIYTSSMVAVGNSDKPDQIRTNEDWLSEDSNEIYSISKRDSEKLAWELARKYNIQLISILPGPVLGRYDYHITPSNIFITDILQGNGFNTIMNLPFVDVRDVAKIHVSALEKGKPGKRYFALTDSLPVKDLAGIVQNLTGKKSIHLPTPRFLDIQVGAMLEVIGKLTSWIPPFTKGVAETFSHRFPNYDYSPTIQDLKYEPTPIIETVKDTINWFLFLGIGKVEDKYRINFVPEEDWVR